LFLIWARYAWACTSASEQSQSPAVRVAAFHFWVAEWTFSCACVQQQALCVNSAFLFATIQSLWQRILLNLDTTFFPPYRGGREGVLEGHTSWMGSWILMIRKHSPWANEDCTSASSRSWIPG
jgi:hypothetical protein